MYAIEHIIIACLLIGFGAGWIVAMIYATHRQNRYFEEKEINTIFIEE